MSVVIQEPIERPFRVPGYAGYVPGLKYSFGHTYGYCESRLFKSQHPEAERSISDARPPTVERRVQWSTPAVREQLRHAAVQCTLPEASEREGLRSAATQWSDQEAHARKRLSAATQWSTADFNPLKSIPGYTGHLPGRHYVNPGKSFCKEMDTLLTTFHPKSNAVLPLSRYSFTSALQQVPEAERKPDPYFDPRPPSTYANNYPIPGYQGFVPRVRTSTSSLGIRYIKAVEKSLHALHEQKNRANPETPELFEDDVANSPKKMLDKRPLHTPRHKPHPRNDSGDWRLMYRRPPSTYLEENKTFIPGYRGFVPHMRGSPNVVGVRYSKAAQRCLAKTFPKAPHNEPQEEEWNEENKENEEANEENPPLENDEEETPRGDNRLRKNTSAERPAREEHSERERKPSTYRSDERYPIPGYQGFVPRLRDSPTTLGLRYTKAALKTLDDVHRLQAKKVNG